jgi:beta-galactosidase
VTDTGVRLEVGSRQHYSPSSQSYRQAAVDIAEKIAERYAHHPAVVMWHINNEYSCHVGMSFDEESAAAFRVWLKEKYPTLDRLNEAWGTAFWSQQYSQWEEIQPPRKAPTYPNPSQVLDFHRFSSQALQELCRAEIAAVRKYNPALPVTTNFMGIGAKFVDQFAWAADLDVCSWDSYPDPSDEKGGMEAGAMGHDLVRSTRGGQPFLLMEQTTTQVNWRPVNTLKPPGLMRAQSWQAVARGADGVLFFQWRAAKAGAEKFHSALLPHIGTQGSRVWNEVCGLGKELAASSEIAGSRVKAEAGILFDWENWWAVELPSKPRELSYPNTVLHYYQAFYHQNIAVDFVHPAANLSGYRVLVAPLLYMISSRTAESLKAFVRDGGKLIVTWFSGIVDEHDHIQLGGYPALLREVLGLRVTEWQPMPEGVKNSVRISSGGASAPCDYWADILETEGAKVLGTFEQDFFQGAPAITENAYGKGAAYYLGTRFDETFTRELIRNVCVGAGVSPVLETPYGVEASLRGAGENQWLFLVNHTQEARQVALGAFAGTDLLSGKQVKDSLAMEPYGVSVLRLGS